MGDMGVVDGKAWRSRIVCGDALDVLRALPVEQKVGVVIADPPYNIGKDFGGYADNRSLSDYVEWTQSWLQECRRLLKDDGVIYLYGFPEILAHVAVRYPVSEQRWLVWHYTNKTVPSSTFWQRSHESILCLWKSGEKRPTLEIDQIRESYTPGFINGAAGRARAPTPSRYGRDDGRRTIYRAHEKGALPRDVIRIPALAGGAGAQERCFLCRDCGDEVFPPRALKNHRGHDTVKHPTQKPMALTERLIRSRINDGNGRVLIPFAGSGSECVVARNLGVDFLGIEINPDYTRFAEKWLENSAQHESDG